MIDRDKFFTAVRQNPFGGTMNQKQVDGCNTILDQWEARMPEEDIRWLAYVLATTFWETARTIQPIEEYGHGAGHPYGQIDPETGKAYYGRGYVQLTWKQNYLKQQTKLGVPLVAQPELALDPRVAADIMFGGMKDGDFTGVGLPRYFSEATNSPVGARRIINGDDHANDIAEIHYQFLAALA